MQPDHIFASHTCFGGHVDVNCFNKSQFINFKCIFSHEKDYKHTCDTIYAHFQGITNNMYAFGRNSFAHSLFYPSTHISTHPYWFFPVQMTGGWVSA